LKVLDLKLNFNQDALPFIPTDGPLLVVANHPLSGIEALAIGDVLGERRQDLKILGHHALAKIPELTSYIIPVNPLSRKADARALSTRAIYSLFRWMSAEHAILIFPAGWVSRSEGSKEQWNSSLGMIIRKIRPTVLPIFFEGSPSLSFQFLQALSRDLASLWLPNEILRQKGSTVRFFIGTPVAPNDLTEAGLSNEAIATHLKALTYSLSPAMRNRKAHRLEYGAREFGQ
jgi:putative hemolysin